MRNIRQLGLTAERSARDAEFMENYWSEPVSL